MNAELKARWIEALRSGRYNQGTCALRIKDNFCCLGVLCDVIDPRGWIRTDDPAYVYRDMENGEILPRIGYLPETLAIRIGFGGFSPMSIERDLSAMNDKGDSFHVIAQWIDDNIPADE